MTVAEFEAIDLPPGWLKNQPREGDPDAGFFARSPGELMDGPLTKAEHFGYEWEHVTTTTETNIPMDNQGLLSANTISKYHEVTYNAWKLVNILVSPEGDRYIRVSRDEGRMSDTNTFLIQKNKLVHHEKTSSIIRASFWSNFFERPVHRRLVEHG